MGWLRKVWNSGARRYLLIGIIAATGVGTPVAVSIGTAVDQGITEIENAE